ncbi:fimbrial protein [Aeromonas caviae]|uniref:fimbrial protein n=1 Tax=Aeromonas caviae TaxID=648 RepID=UPI001433395E|nr:fimbrial protein [Aeromonas caviae]NKD17335.1 type 1 fimbrial protein [Aeromonas caviae]
MKVQISSALVGALFTGASFAADIEGGSSIVKFTGEIKESTCVINTSQSKLDVDMGTVSTQAFSGAGSTSAEKDFSISLTGCSGLTSAYIHFKGNTADSTTLISGNSSVGIQVKQDGQLVALDGSSKTNNVEFSGDGNATLNFTANYIQIASTISAGAATAQADFTVYYQ